MKLTILGCSGGGPGPDSPASGYLVEAGDTRIVLDLGNGTFGALQRVCDPFAVDALLLSHLHPDHCADVAAQTVYRCFHPRVPADLPRLPVFGPPETSERLAALCAASPGEMAASDLSNVYDFRSQPEQPVRIGDFEIQAIPVNHVVPCWGFRIAAEGRVLAYTGDTGPTDTLLDLGRESDVLLSEASWEDHTDAPPNVHLSGRQAARYAVDADARRLLLTHVMPWSDRSAIEAEAAAVYPGPMEWVVADQQYTV